MGDFIHIPRGVDLIEIRKKEARIIAKARSKAKPEKCILCGKPQTSFCNSHSVPMMVLRSIADKGKVLLSLALVGFDREIHDIELGVKASGTFHYICENCDNTFFQDYENDKNIIMKPNEKMLAEIAVKNYLLQLSKCSLEKELYTILQRQYNILSDFQKLMATKNTDLAEFEAEVRFHQNIACNNLTGQYNILFWKVLPYTVPIATQSTFVLNKDIEGTKIINIYDENPNIRMQYMHLAIFPFNGESVVLLYHHKRDREYRRLAHQLNSISEDKILIYINYLVFKFTDNYFVSHKIENEINTNAKLQALSREYDDRPSLGILNFSNNYGRDYTPIASDDIPNFLSPEWAI